MIKKILLVVAMEEEANEIINQLRLDKINDVNSLLTCKMYQGCYEQLKIYLLTTGKDSKHKVDNIGTIAAALTTYEGIRLFNPDLVINIGTAGGVRGNGACINDIYVSNLIDFYDRRIPLPGFQEYGLGSYSCMPLAKISDIKIGKICSGNSFDENPYDFTNINNLKCQVIDMEAGGVAWVCELLSVPMVALKGITNYISGPGLHQDFQTNFYGVNSKLMIKLEEIFKVIYQK